MKKYHLIIFLTLPVLLFGKNWYTSNTSSGSANADSWTNKRALSSFSWSQVAPGDTVFIDGGTDSLIYNHCIYIPSGTLSGTSSSKIVITKGKDAGHNGKAIIGGNTSSLTGAGLYAYGINYTEWSYLNFKGASDNTTSSTIVTIGITNSVGVDILHCDIRNDASDGVVLVSCQNVRVMYCNIHNEKNTQWATDGFHIDGASGKNLEIAYNTISSNNPQNVTSIRSHKDLIQFALGYGGTGGTVKIHHNFFNDYSNSNNACGIIYAYDVGGNWEIYNNILYTSSNSMTGVLQILDLQNFQTNVKVSNNTFYASKSTVQPMSLYGIDSLTFVNNIVHMQANWVGWLMDYSTDVQGVYKNINYNQYYVNGGDSSSSSFAYMHESWARVSSQAFSLSWSQWKARGYDVNGSFFKPASFKYPGGTRASDYKLLETSRGINEGKAQNIFNDDFEGTTRPQGGAWDKGAFEFNNGTTGGGDITPPKLIGAVISNSTTVVLTFSEPLESVSAINKANYSINNGILVSGAALSSTGTKVTLTTTTHSTGSYIVTVTNVKDLAGNIISTNNTSQYSVDNTPPGLSSAVQLDSVNVELTFTEPLESTSALNKYNYNINNYIVVQGARLSVSPNKVILTTSQLANGQTYTATVQNVKDLAGNIIQAPNNVKQFSCTYDVTPPEVTGLSITNSRTITINFSERLNTASANSVSNYSISNSISVQSVELQPDSLTVILKTSYQHRATTYYLTVKNIKDRAGNLISPNPQVFSYVLYKKGRGDVSPYTILSTSSSHWTGDFLPEKTTDGEGMQQLQSRWLSNTIMPDTIEYDLGKVNPVDSLRTSFFSWESDKYKYSVYSSEDGKNWQPVVENIWSENIEWTEIEFAEVQARYLRLVLLEGSGNVWASIWEVEVFGKKNAETISTEIPENFNLSQNYPNPFNPSTKIVVSLPQNTNMRLTVYNMIGEFVSEIASGEFNAGNHEFYFDASGLASGVYIYRIDTPQFVETKKMMLLR